MKTLAPHIFRQRLLIEGHYTASISKAKVEEFLNTLPGALNLNIYSPATVFSPEGKGKAENQGYDGFIALIDSGISIYIWEAEKFVSIIIYTCKPFNEEQALQFTQNFFKTDQTVTQSF